MSGSPASSYSQKTLDHFRKPRNVGRLEDANAIGTVDDQATETLISLYLRIEGDQVKAARFRTFGCSACIATSSMATELVVGRPLMTVRAIDGPAILAALDGLPPGQEYCAELTAQAIGLALDSFATTR